MQCIGLLAAVVSLLRLAVSRFNPLFPPSCHILFLPLFFLSSLENQTLAQPLYFV